MIKTFRGNIERGTEQKIRLSTKKGKVGYRILNFKAFPPSPGTSNYEATLQVFKISQASVSADTAAVDFADGNLLAALYIEGASSNTNTDTIHVMFEQEVFNQDVYITMSNTETGSMNYYLELETMNLTDNAAAVSTLRDIRLNPQVGA